MRKTNLEKVIELYLTKPEIRKPNELKFSLEFGRYIVAVEFGNN